MARALSERGVPFAFSTGYGRQGVCDGYASRPVLNKPFNLKELVEILESLLAEPLGEAS